MKTNQLTPEIFAFCKALSQSEIQKLPFQKPKFEGIENREIVEQAICYQSAKEKLPEWWNSGLIYFPDKTTIEQSTSEWVARWKSSLVPPDCELFVDATAGLGVDAFYLGSKAKKKLLFEIDPERCSALKCNLEQLEFSKFRVENQSFDSYLKGDADEIHRKTFVYADPDRRPQGQERKWNWADTEPNILDLYQSLKATGCRFLAKLSPMDNMGEVLKQMPGTEGIFTVSLHNEVKELLILWNFSKPETQLVNWVVEISKSGHFRQIEIPENQQKEFIFTQPKSGMFLLDPWAALRKGFQSFGWMKAQGFCLISIETQLYLSDSEPLDFPGRVFQVLKVIPELNTFGKQNQKGKFHVIARNFPQSAEAIKKKFAWVESGNQFIFCYQSPDKQNVFLMCQKMDLSFNQENQIKLPQFL